MKRPAPTSRSHALLLVAAMAAATAATGALASSHREAPFIATQPKVDGTDFYMFMSYEPGRDGYVTLIANYEPLQDAYGGPNYFSMDPDALYEIHIDNNGDAKEDLTFQFRFQNKLKSQTRNVGGKDVAIPLILSGTVSAPNDPNLNVGESFTVDLIRGDRRSAQKSAITNVAGGSTVFAKPVDNIGTKSVPDYASYAARHIYNVNVPGCGMPARLFVGQRKDPFALNLGVIFDRVNAPLAVVTDPTLINAAPNTIDDKSVTELAIEVHKSCLTAGGDPVIGGWTTSSIRQARLLSAMPASGLKTTDVNGGAWVQVSRLGQPLINELVIGLPDKDRFNGSQPKNDAQFATYVTNPTLPVYLAESLGIPGTEPKNIPRNDFVTVFLTGIKGLNQPANVVASEMLRLNTNVPATPEARQNRLGIVGNILAGGTDNAGFPNGRRPKDDVVDISLAAAMGALCMANGDGNALGFGTDCKPANVPLGATSFKLHDAVDQSVVPLLPGFPYLYPPQAGAGQ
jgi:hypothetical protein